MTTVFIKLFSDVMEKETARMALTNQQHAPQDNAAQVHSNAKTTTALHQQQSVMEQTIAAMAPMNKTATYLALS